MGAGTGLVRPAVKIWGHISMNVRLLFAPTVALLGIIGQGCRGPAPRELARVASNDGKVDAVVWERLTDATVPTPFEVYIVRRGHVPTDDHLVLRIDKSSSPEVRWLRDNELAIRCAGARVWHFRNFAIVKLSNGSFWSGTVMLECGVGRYEDSRLYTPRP